MNTVSICVALMLIAINVSVAQHGPSYLNIPEQTSFNDQSALNVKSNLQSKNYQDFIRTLYHLDKNNLARVEDLFAHPDKVDQVRSRSEEPQQPSYSDYIKSQGQNNYFGISHTNSRFKRNAQGAIFRPLFVYRIFQERTLQREKDRMLRRRLLANQRCNEQYGAEVCQQYSAIYEQHPDVYEQMNQIPYK